MPVVRRRSECQGEKCGGLGVALISGIASGDTSKAGTTGLNGVFNPNPPPVHDRVTSACDYDVWR